MIELNVPGRGNLQLEHLVTDVNGTLAVDGVLLDGVAKRIASVRDQSTVHLLTADTHGRQAVIDQQLDLIATRLREGMNRNRSALSLKNSARPKSLPSVRARTMHPYSRPRHLAFVFYPQKARQLKQFRPQTLSSQPCSMHSTC